MVDNDREKAPPQNSGEVDATANETAPSYHAPVLTSFGTLAELVKINPGTGSDGGTGDCQHA